MPIVGVHRRNFQVGDGTDWACIVRNQILRRYCPDRKHGYKNQDTRLTQRNVRFLLNYSANCKCHAWRRYITAIAK